MGPRFLSPSEGLVMGSEMSDYVRYCVPDIMCVAESPAASRFPWAASDSLEPQPGPRAPV